jgi:hypothetical protein
MKLKRTFLQIFPVKTLVRFAFGRLMLTYQQCNGRDITLAQVGTELNF